MEGRVTAGGEAVLPVRVSAPASLEAGPSAEVKAVIDTGFTGYLTLPSETVTALIPEHDAGDPRRWEPGRAGRPRG